MPGRILSGLLGGAAGLTAMEAVRRATKPLMKGRAPTPTEVPVAERERRSMSPLGPHHEPGEPATTALGRMAYALLVGREPSRGTKRALSWGVHIVYGLIVATAYGALRARSRHPVRDGVLFGAALWAVGDELVVPLLGLSDRPSAYHPTQHLQSLAQHLGFGVATAAAVRRVAAELR